MYIRVCMYVNSVLKKNYTFKHLAIAIHRHKKIQNLPLCHTCIGYFFITLWCVLFWGRFSVRIQREQKRRRQRNAIDWFNAIRCHVDYVSKWSVFLLLIFFFLFSIFFNRIQNMTRICIQMNKQSWIYSFWLSHPSSSFHVSHIIKTDAHAAIAAATTTTVICVQFTH